MRVKGQSGREHVHAACSSVCSIIGGRADQVFVDAAGADQPARRAIGHGVVVVDLAGANTDPSPSTRRRRGGLVGQLRLDQTCRGHVEAFDHDGGNPRSDSGPRFRAFGRSVKLARLFLVVAGNAIRDEQPWQ
jgi:hypothetical protein